MHNSRRGSNSAKAELHSVLKALGRVISEAEKHQLFSAIPDISMLSGETPSWFFAPLAEGIVNPKDMRKFISAGESIYCGLKCGHFALFPNMHAYIAVVYLFCERTGGSATSMAAHAVDHLLAALEHLRIDKRLVEALLRHMDIEVTPHADSEVSEWQKLLAACRLER